MRFEQLLQVRNPEHLTPGIVSLHKAVAVEEEALSRGERDFMLLVAAPGQHPKWHARGPEFRNTPLLLTVGQLMSCIGVVQPPALGAKQGKEAGDKHPGWNISSEQIVDPRYDPARRRASFPRCTKDPKDAGH